MAYLDVSPMISALRERPEEFDLQRGWLRHLPSRHQLKFNSGGDVILNAECECARLSLNPVQTPALRQGYESWRTAYWEPLIINRQFAAHFKRLNLWKRFYRTILRRMRPRSRSTRFVASEPARRFYEARPITLRPGSGR